MKIVRYPHPSLRFAAKPLTAIDKQVQLSIGAMLELMYEGKGLGLAGPQVVYPFQVFVMNLEPEQRDKEAVFINPIIIERKSTIEGEEGCLSFPGLYQRVRRAKTVRYRAYNLTGDMIEGTTTSDLEARVWQHEVDHLHGELFIDKMGPLAKLSARGDLHQFEREYRKAQEKGEIPSDADIKKTLEILQGGGTPEPPAAGAVM
ncbi:MAG TPA: peptide deformylase [Gemmataceae bacterium]|jgi:peptide deformylase|nr:peptide deformylase [Gemmataceae bacterium]